MDIQLPQIIFQIINFGVVAGALTFLLFKPVKKMLDQRSAKVEEAQKAAEATLAEKQHIDEMKKKSQKEAEKEAAKVIEAAQETAKKMETDLMNTARKKAKAEIEQEYKEWEAEKAALIKQFRSSFVDEVTNMTAQVLGTAVDSKIITKQVDESIEQIVQRI